MPADIERLYREHRAGLIRLVERELHDRHEAEDVVQTAFLDAQRALERGTIPHNPRAWLAAIALNAGRRLRRRRLDAEPLEEYAVHEASGLSEIRAALASLPPEQRAAVLYRDVLGLSYAETAEQMGTSLGAVTMLLHRGRQRLRQTLAGIAAPAGLWRWLKQGGAAQAAALKGSAAAVVAAGLATGGVVAAREVAPMGTHLAAAPAMRPGALTLEAGRAPGGALPNDLHGRHRKANAASRPKGASTSTPTQGSGSDATLTSARSSTAAGPAPSTSTSILGVPTVYLPTVTVPTLPVTVAATVAVSTPIVSTTVTVPTSVTVTTPLTTVTVPIP